MTARICRTEKFIPRNGNPVFQIQEEVEFNGTLQLLPPRNPTAQELLDVQDAFATAQQSRIAELETELASTKQSLEAKTQEASTLATERDSLRSQLDAANEELAEQTEELIDANASLVSVTQERDTLQGQLDTATDEIETKGAEIMLLNGIVSMRDARIAKLLGEIPFNPREISLAAFKARLEKVLSPQDLIRLYAAEADPILKQIASTIVAWEDKYPIKLDSRELREPLGYLLTVQVITEEEQTYLVSDSTRAEAFFPAEQST